MNVWHPTDEYRRIATANRRYYAKTAAQYDATECCVTDTRLQQALEADLDEALETVGKPPGEIAALDACGGSGNVSLKLLRRGVQVTLVDISDELQQIFLRRATASGFKPLTVLGEVGDYLATTNRTFDLVVFSSALHHLHSIDPVLEAAYRRLNPGGVVFTTFDPTAQDDRSWLTRGIQRADYLAFKLLRQPRDFPVAIARRLKRMAAGIAPGEKSRAPLDDSTAGMLAEYHVERGIDDRALARSLASMGYHIVAHRRFVESRFTLARKLIEWTGDVTQFKLLVQKPARQDVPSDNV